MYSYKDADTEFLDFDWNLDSLSAKIEEWIYGQKVV